MAIDIHSPHSGLPVKVREQDVGRAVRDEQGRIFYVLQRPSGQGHYASKTRAGGEAAEQAYDALEKKEALSEQAAHDATGTPRSNTRGKLVIAMFVLIVAAMVALWLFTVGPLGDVQWHAPPSDNQPQQGASATSLRWEWRQVARSQPPVRSGLTSGDSAAAAC